MTTEDSFKNLEEVRSSPCVRPLWLLTVALVALVTVPLHVSFAGTLTSGETVTGSITTVGGGNSYNLELSAGERALLEAGTISGSLEPYIRLYDPEGSLLDQDGGWRSAATLSQRVAATGSYTVVVQDYEKAGLGAYRLHYLKIPGALGADGVRLESGQALTNSLPVGGFHAYAFDLSVGDSLVIEAGTISGTLEPDMWLYDPQGAYLDGDGGWRSAATLADRATVSGTYTVVLRDYENGTGSGNYWLGLFGNMLPGYVHTLTFDDLPDSPGNGLTLPAGYGGLQWDNFGFVDAMSDVGNSGYPPGTVSRPNVAYNGGGNPASITSSFPFDLISASLTAAHLDNLIVEVQGLWKGTLIYDKAFTLSATSPTVVSMNYTDVDGVDFISSGGTQHPGYTAGGRQFAMDNVTIGTSPQSTVVLANPLWTDTGVFVTNGTLIGVSASGAWNCGGTPPPPSFGAGGDLNPGSPPSSDRFYFGAPHGALIAYVGPDPLQGHWGDGNFFPRTSGYWLIGSSSQFTADTTGELWLGFNDDAVSERVSDNSGWVLARWTLGQPSNPSSPSIVNGPGSQTAQAGDNVTFSATASGSSPLTYQWRRDGEDIAGATDATLTLGSVTAADSGGYSLVVSNPYGSAVSAAASLSVLADGANGSTPVQVSLAGVIVKQPNKTGLVVVTHGWVPKEYNLAPWTTPPILPSWVPSMADAIQSRVSSDWQVVAFDWALQAWTFNPDSALEAAKVEGGLLGNEIAGQSWQRVHLIAHSAGAGLIQAAADVIRLASPTTVIQTTFLDPFVGFNHGGLSWYGANADWSDDYFTPVDAETSPAGDTTGLPLPKAYAVDVSWVGPHYVAWYVASTGGEVAVSSHGYPIDFYMQSITHSDPSWCGAGYGFDLSEEREGPFWRNNYADEPVGTSPIPPCSPIQAVRNPYSALGAVESPVWAGSVLVLSSVAHAVSETTSAVVNGTGAVLSNIWSRLSLGGSDEAHLMGGGTSTNIPAWLAVAATVTNAVNFVQFDASFADTNAAQGLLTVYWNTNQLGMIDERVAQAGLQTCQFGLPGIVTNGVYTLSFRLDSFAESSSIMVTNVATGFIGVSTPPSLALTLTNGTPVLDLTGVSGYSYLVQSSTNLVDWAPVAVLSNTNGAVTFTDTSATNSTTRFYRALAP